MKSALFLYSLVIFIIGIYTALLGFSNYFFKRRDQKRMNLRKNEGKVSVLVPARNEEKNLPRLLDSLVSQDYEDYEVLVIDDQSSDGTWAIIQDYEKRYPDLIKGYQSVGRPEKGQNGKIHALEQIAPMAKGKYIFPTDADTIHKKDSISYGVTVLEDYGLDMASGLPEESGGTYFGNCIIAAMNIIPVFFVPMPFALKHPWVMWTVANGQYIIFRKDTFLEIGGYKPIEREIVDDVMLAKSFVRHKKKYAFLQVSDRVKCNMYGTAHEAFEGIGRSIGGFFPPKWWAFFLLLVVIAFLFGVAVAPAVTVIMLCCNTFKSNAASFILNTSGWLLSAFSWYVNCRQQRFDRKTSLSYALTIHMIYMMYFHSFFNQKSGRNFNWKGRTI